MVRSTCLLVCLVGIVLARAEDLNETLGGLVAELGGRALVEVAYLDLESGETCLIRADEQIHPASTMKLPVMLEVYRQAGEGKFALDDRLPITNAFASIADGSPFTLDPKDDSELSLYGRVGGSATIRELLRLMITESSNLATNLLVDKVSPSATSAFMGRLGADGLKVLRGVEDGKAYAKGLNNQATARGLMTILSRIADGSAVSKLASDEMMTLLRAQKFNEGIPAGLPAGVVVAHKTGSFRGVYHDAGVVEMPGRRPFVLVVLTRGIDDEARAHKLVADIARATHAHVLRR